MRIIRKFTVNGVTAEITQGTVREDWFFASVGGEQIHDVPFLSREAAEQAAISWIVQAVEQGHARSLTPSAA